MLNRETAVSSKRLEAFFQEGLTAISCGSATTFERCTYEEVSAVKR